MQVKRSGAGVRIQHSPSCRSREQDGRCNCEPGVQIRHSRGCPSRKGGKCSSERAGGCVPSFEASVWDPRVGESGAKRRQSFATLDLAREWRASTVTAKRRGTLATPSKRTLREAWDDWYAGATAEPPRVLARGGRPYKPSVLRMYETQMRLHVLDDLGAHCLRDLRRGHLQALAERLIGAGKDASTIRNIMMPLRAVYRREMGRDETLSSPLAGLQLPTGLGVRERAVGVDEAEELIGALPESDRAVWATAFYAGLRRGELQALRWSDVDLAGGLIRVARSWDEKAGYIAPKSQKGTRAVPIMGALRDHLLAHKARTGRDSDDLVFGSKPTHPFTATAVRLKALRMWEAANVKRAEEELAPLKPIGFHELRHSCVTLFHEAGLSLEEIGDLVGHSSTYMSDRYRHLRDDHRDTLAARLDAYAALSSTTARLQQITDAESE